MALLYSKSALLFFLSLAIVKEYETSELIIASNITVYKEPCTMYKNELKVCQQKLQVTTANNKVFDCHKMKSYSPNATSGVFKVCANGACVQAYCDMETNGGGWTVFQRRGTNTTVFKQTWDDYADGFGNADDFWLGNKIIHKMTAGRSCELHIALEDWENATRYATYQKFTIDGEGDKFRLHIGAYSGDAGDSLSYHNGMNFSTYDQDNDAMDNFHCAHGWVGAWWHGSCARSDLNGRYYSGYSSGRDGVRWYDWRQTHHYSYKKTAMMFRCSN